MKRYFKITFLVTTVSLVLLFAHTAFAAGGKVSLEVENTARGIRLEWSECEGAYYYEVYRQTGKKGDKLLLSKVQNVFYDDTAASEGKTYSYTVVPVFADYSTGDESDTATLYRMSASFISGAGSQRNGLYIKWKSVKNAKGYRVYRKTAEDSEWMSVAKLGADAKSYIDGEINPGQRYTYCVKAFMGEYEGCAGNEKELSYISYPSVKGITNTDNGILLSWEGGTEAAYYVIYRKMGDETAYRPCALLDADYTEYEDKSALAGQVCSYYICGADAEGNMGSYDREISLRHVRKSEITAAVNTVKGIKLFWSKSEGCQGYAIFKKAKGDKGWKLRGIVYGDSNLSAVDSKVSNKELYTYTVRSFRDKTLATYDNEGATLRFYAAPEKVSCKADKEKGNVLKWSAVTSADSYAVYRKETDSDWKFLGFTTDNSFNDKALQAKKKYVYGVEVYEGSVLRSGRAEVTAK